MKKEKIFLKLSKVIKTKEQCSDFVSMLINSILENKSITDNSLLDGFIVGLIYSNSGYVYGLIKCIELPHMTDNQIQQLEQITIWILNNEIEIIKKYKQYISVLKPIEHESSSKYKHNIWD